MTHNLSRNVTRCLYNKLPPLLLVLLISSASDVTAIAAEQVEAWLHDGRVVIGNFDRGTDDSRLRLRNTAPGVELKSSFRWETIVAARYDETAYSADEFRRLVLGWKLQPPTKPEHAASPERELFDPDPASAWARRLNDATLYRQRKDVTHPHILPHSPHRPGVCSVRIEAYPANWDSDVETDGLQVIVRPLDEHGTVVAVDGRIEFHLIGRQLGSPPQLRHNGPFPELGRWTEHVKAYNFGPHGAVVELPFQLAHPEFDLDLGAEGLLTARLSIPGEGVFDASFADVLLRPFSRMRDERQLFEEERYFPVERTRRTRRAPDSRFARPKLRG